MKEKYFAMTTPECSDMEKEHLELSRQIAADCMVLLENDGVLPLKRTGRVALYGNGARQTVKGGTGSGEVNSRYTVSVEQGLEEAGFQITTKDWLDRYDRKRNSEIEKYNSWVKEQALAEKCSEFYISFSNPLKETAPVPITQEDLSSSDTDTAIYVLARNSGEGADRRKEPGDYLPFPEEMEILEYLGTHYRNLILVLNIGGVMELTQLKEISGLRAILLMTQLGNIGGNALADVLTGKVTPSGKLADTWALKYEDYPSSAAYSHRNGNLDDEYYTEGIYVGYRYFDTYRIPRLYPFGYGKSYTDFSMSTESVTLDQDQVTIIVKVTNTGEKYSGKEVIQVYYSAPEGKLHKPYQELAAFRKTKLLAPGESITETLSFPVSAMSSYSEEEAAWLLEPGDYIIRVGSSSASTKAEAVITLAGLIKISNHRNCLQAVADYEELDGCADRKSEQSEFSVDGLDGKEMAHPRLLRIEEKAFSEKRYQYTASHPAWKNLREEKLTLDDVLSGACSVQELAAQLTAQELASLCVGQMRNEAGSTDIIGNAATIVPGAAGETSSICMEERNIPPVVMADGPAGLRLEPEFTVMEDGQEVHYYQYCTAIPIEWALAQSWDMDLLAQAGDMVGKEMERFHVHLWLAPAVNIHRNPLCGRNYEYYSEDPLLSGKAASALIGGVQKHPGKGVTIKHFAANNQEDNRYFNNSHVSERTMREIYLKAFEIAIKEASPMALMTSYNLLNGTHTANHFGLLQNILRDEWGFEGVVMTDWFTSQDIPEFTGTRRSPYPISSSVQCIAAGNDLQMPGCRKNVDDILEAIGKELDPGDLQFTACNVLHMMVRLWGKGFDGSQG